LHDAAKAASSDHLFLHGDSKNTEQVGLNS